MNAPSKANEIKGALTAAITFLTALWGKTGWAIIVLFAAIALDYITGSWSAAQKGEWSSSVARQGLWHKIGEIAALCVAALCDIAIKVITDGVLPDKIGEFDLPAAGFTLMVCFWYIFTELGSIIENISELGAPVPKFLVNAIKKIKDKADPEAEEKPPEI